MEKKIYSWFYFITCFIAILLMGSIIPASVQGQACTTTTFSYTGPAVAIPDNNIVTGASIPITVSGVGIINDLNFRLDAFAGNPCYTTSGDTNASVSHTFIGDLDFTLTSPGGTTVAFMNDNGSGGNNFCTLVLDDDGGFPSITTLPTTGAASGNFAPELPFSAFDGQNADGVWTLKVFDDAAGDLGFVRRFSLIICGIAAPPCSPTTVSYTGPAVSIPDANLSGVNIPLTVAGVGTITDLNFRLDALTGGTCNSTAGNTDASVSHTFLADLDFTLTSPGGTTVAFMSDNGGGGNNFCTLLLDDDGAFPSVTTIPTTGGVGGNFAPESPFTAFDGQNANGIWTLNIVDDLGADTGSLRRFSLIFNTCAPPPPVAPANDLCANAIPLICGQTLAGTTVNATAESPAPPACGTFTAPGVWYSFTGNGGNVVLSLCAGTAYDSKLSVFSGTCAGLTCIVNNDDFCSLQSQVTVPTTAGTTYLALVHGFGTNTGAFSIAMTCPPPANDNCASPTAITCGQTLSGTTINATADVAPFCATTVTTPGVWYSFTGTGGSATVSLCSAASYDTKLSVYTGTCGALVCAGGNDDFCSLRSEVTVATTAGTTYLVLVHGFGGATGTFSIALTCAAPANDLCANAVPVTCGSATNGTTLASTADAAGTCVVTNTSGGVWYKFTGNGALVGATTCGGTTNFDTKISVFSGTCGALVCVTGDDDAGCGLTSSVGFPTVLGTDYYILVHGFSSATGNFTLSLTCIYNDLCTGALPIACGDALDGSTSGATLDGGGTCGVSNTAGGVWYKFAGTGDKVALSTCLGTTNYDTKLSVYTGTCGGLVCVGGNDDGGEPGCAASFSSKFTFCTNAGTDYYILVHGFSTATGNFTLSLTCSSLTATALATSDYNGKNISCYGESNGSASASISGGISGPNTYIWSDGQTTEEATGLSAGSYSVTVIDAGGCSATAEVTLTEPDTFTVTATVLSNYNGYNISCFGANDGFGTVIPSGGTGTPTYLWSNGQTSKTATGLSSTTYTITATDANGCTAESSITLTEPDPLTAAASATPVTCFGGNTGSAEALPIGGVPGYTYLWSDGQTTKIATALAIGSYTVTVTDLNGCTATASATVTEPPLLTVDAGVNRVVYYGYPDSACTSLNPIGAGGTPPYTYGWSTGGSGTINVCPTVTTTYYVTVTDANGCTAIDTVKVCSIDVRCGNRMDNIILCHFTGSGYQTICVDINGARNHFRSHAGQDLLAACGTSRICTLALAKTEEAMEMMEENSFLTAIPNPFTDNTAVRFMLADDDHATLEVFDVTGKKVTRLYEGKTVSGLVNEVTFDGSRYESGVYFLSLSSSNGERTMKKIILAR